MSIILPDGQERVGSKSDHLFHACQTAQHEGGIASFVALRFPAPIACEFVERDEAGTVNAADRQNDFVLIDHSRTIVTAAAGCAFISLAAEEFHFEVALVTRLPDGFAVGEIQTT